MIVRMLGVAVMLMAASPAVAATDAARINRASDGYAYFNRAGSSLADHDAAVDACVRQASQTQQPYLAPVIAGPLTQMIIASSRAAKQRRMGQVQFAANLENCMVAAGWAVVRLDDSEGKAIAALPQPQQAAALAPWVGAAQPHGQIARRYAPIDAMRWNSGSDDSPGPSSLSLTAGVHDLGKLVTPATERPANWRTLQTGEAKTVAAPTASVIVLRVQGAAPDKRTWTFVRLDEPSKGADPSGLTFFTVARPANEAGLAPPGRWRLQSVGAASFCLGGPSFDVGAGEAVFAGTFDASNPYAPDFDPAPAKSDLGDAALAARLKPAAWINGETFACGVMQPTSIYVLAFPGVPSASR